MILSIANQRGGVAKSTTAINPAAGLAQEGRKVLLIDKIPRQIPQESLFTRILRLTSTNPFTTLQSSFLPYPQCTKDKVSKAGYWPSHIRLSTANLELAQALDNRSERLKRAIGNLKEKYDYIIIDNPRSEHVRLGISILQKSTTDKVERFLFMPGFD